MKITYTVSIVYVIKSWYVLLLVQVTSSLNTKDELPIQLLMQTMQASFQFLNPDHHLWQDWVSVPPLPLTSVPGSASQKSRSKVTLSSNESRGQFCNFYSYVFLIM
jgi:hypothetical protein